MKFSFKFVVVLLLLKCYNVYSQNNLDSLASKYETKAKSYKEIVYCHLNKVKFIKGEDLAFKAYVLNKNTSKLSNITNNLYCRIVDKNKNVVKEGLFLVQDGTSNNLFKIDSLFASNKYYFQAYTNWQRNSTKDYSFSQEIEVLDFENKREENLKIEQKLDIQILPEGGNFISGIQNTLGVVIKNEFDLGVKPDKVTLLENNVETNNIPINNKGLGKFNITPTNTKSYKLKVNYRNNEYLIDFPQLKNNGTNLNVTYLRDKILISVSTKNKTLNNTLVIHNSINSKLIEIKSNAKSNIVTSIPFKDLFAGVNILTLLNKNGQPISERLVFNYNNLRSIYPQFSIGKLNDSLRLTIKIPSKLNNIESSLSILPSLTKSSNRYSNIINHFGLNHFINGTLEDPHYYFSKIDFRKEYDLDLLCMTQGWSSYNFNELISPKENSAIHDFHKGIDLSFNVNKYKTGNFIVHKLQNTKPFFINLTEEDLTKKPSFEINGLFPINNEVVNVSEINKDGTLDKASLVVNFKPNMVPGFSDNKSYNFSNENNLNTVINPIFSEELVVLDEVTINAQKKVTKYEKLKRRSNGTVDVFDDVKRSANLQFSSYIASKGFLVQEQLTTGELTILNPRRTTLGALQPPIIFLDGVLLADFSILSNFTMDIVDYIEIDKSGTGQGIRGATGFIKIFTDPQLKYKNSNYSNFQKNTVKIPLAFQEQKKYYTPKYYTYQSNTFKHYGILKWIPKLKIDENGLSYLIIPNTGDKGAYISMQGIDSEGNYVFFEDIISLNE